MTAESSTPPVDASEAEQAADLSVGRYLVRAREARRLSLDDVAHLTKIRRAILESLERDDRDELPEKVFVLGYVRSYAAVVGAPAEEAVRRLNEGWVDEVDGEPAAAAEARRRSFGWVGPLLALALLAGAVWFISTFQ